MILKTKVIVIVAAVMVAAPLAAWAVDSFRGSQLSTRTIACANGPSNVLNTQPVPMVGDRAVSVKWDAMPNCGVVGYNVVVIDFHGTPQQVVATAKSGATGAYVSGLNLCTFYRFGVQATFSDHVSAISFPARPAFVSGPPDKVPPVITVIVTGTSTSGPADSFSPATANFCTSPDGVMPSRNTNSPSLQHLADSWLNVNGPNSDPSTRTSGAGNNLIDSMAATGGYVLPYSYRGIVMTGTAENPRLTVGFFDSLDVSTANPIADCTDRTCRGLGEPGLLQASLASIHRTFPHTPIIVLGHSLGGLIAEQWWLQYSAKDPEGVIQVFSLDSPLNGLATGGSCLTAICLPLVGIDPSRAYSGLWAHQSDPAGSGPYANNETALALDNKNHLFTAVGTIGDPLYDVGDYLASEYQSRNIGLVSQLFWTQPSCAASGWDLTSHDCTLIGQEMKNPCGHNMDDGAAPRFGLFGSLWIHSNVKNCPEVISRALAWYHQYASTHPTPPTSPPEPSCPYDVFLRIARTKAGDTVTLAGQPTCADGYALQLFIPYPGGQEAPFFFKKDDNGSWTLLEGGDATPTVACSIISTSILVKLGAHCPPAGSPATSSPAPTSSPTTGCTATVFLKVMQSQGATVSGVSGQPTCIDGYAEQNFTSPNGPTANYPTFFFYHFNGPLGWRLLGGGAIGDATTVCRAMPAAVRSAFERPTRENTGCPAG